MLASPGAGSPDTCRRDTESEVDGGRGQTWEWRGAEGWAPGFRGLQIPPPSAAIPSPSLRGCQGERRGVLGRRITSRTRRPPPSAISARSGHRRTGVQSVAALTPWPGSARHTQGLGSARTPRTSTTAPLPHGRPASGAAAARDPAAPASPGFHWLPEQPLSRSPAVAQATRPASSWTPRLRARNREAFLNPEQTRKGSVGPSNLKRKESSPRAPPELPRSAPRIKKLGVQRGVSLLRLAVLKRKHLVNNKLGTTTITITAD